MAENRALRKEALDEFARTTPNPEEFLNWVTATCARLYWESEEQFAADLGMEVRIDDADGRRQVLRRARYQCKKVGREFPDEVLKEKVDEAVARRARMNRKDPPPGSS
ncbi:MAG: hypothetical protein OXG13_03945 [Gemmatimonadaceae bacterium]|nr:hypothetical protein [Gemmatimonadaceae bacterium]